MELDLIEENAPVRSRARVALEKAVVLLRWHWTWRVVEPIRARKRAAWNRTHDCNDNRLGE